MIVVMAAVAALGFGSSDAFRVDSRMSVVVQPAQPAAGKEKSKGETGRAGGQEGAAQPVVDPVTMGNQLGFVIQKGTEGQSLTTVSDGKSVAIVDGEATVENSKLNKGGLAQNLRIDAV